MEATARGIVLAGGVVVTSLSMPTATEADVVVRDGRVAAIGRAGRASHPDDGPADAAEGLPERDCSGCVILPGNVCAHTHLYSALARGMPYRLEPPSNFLQILQRVWWRLDRALDEESIRASALVGGMEAILSGTTTLIDHHASPNAVDGSLDVLADALEGIGLRSVLCYEVTDRDGPERARAGLEENRRFLATNGGRRLTRGMSGAHASFTLSEEALESVVGVARDAGVGVHVHVAEDDADERDAERRFGCRVAERLDRAGALDERAMLAHCVHLSPEEAGRIRASGATVAHNARSNMNNSVGRACPRELGERVALGTDGIGSDMFAESQAAYWRAREDDVHADPGWVLARLAESAKFAGRAFGEPLLGDLAVGAPADLIVVDRTPPAPLDGGNVAGHWMFGLAAGAVRDAMVGGELVATDRRLVRVDQNQVAADAARVAGRLWGRLEGIGPHPFEPEGG